MSERDEFFEYIKRCVDTSGRCSRMDNRELLWWIMKTIEHDRGIDDSFESYMWGELEDRLYPEYDGDKVTVEDYGWKTPNGPIIYIQEETKHL